MLAEPPCHQHAGCCCLHWVLLAKPCLLALHLFAVLEVAEAELEASWLQSVQGMGLQECSAAAHPEDLSVHAMSIQHQDFNAVVLCTALKISNLDGASD